MVVATAVCGGVISVALSIAHSKEGLCKKPLASELLLGGLVASVSLVFAVLALAACHACSRAEADLAHAEHRRNGPSSGGDPAEEEATVHCRAAAYGALASVGGGLVGIFCIAAGLYVSAALPKCGTLALAAAGTFTLVSICVSAVATFMIVSRAISRRSAARAGDGDSVESSPLLPPKLAGPQPGPRPGTNGKAAPRGVCDFWSGEEADPVPTADEPAEWTRPSGQAVPPAASDPYLTAALRHDAVSSDVPVEAHARDY